MNCSFYEKHCGEYYQGMWEFNDCCYLSQIINISNVCNDSCPLAKGDKISMIKTLAEEYFKIQEVWKDTEDFMSTTPNTKDNIMKAIWEIANHEML